MIIEVDYFEYKHLLDIQKEYNKLIEEKDSNKEIIQNNESV